MTEKHLEQFQKLEKPHRMIIEAMKMQLSPKYRDKFLENVYYEIYGEGHKDGYKEARHHVAEHDYEIAKVL